MGIGLIVLALLGYAAYWFYTDRRDAAAAAALANAHDATGYQQVISQYENTNAGATAYLLLGDAQRKAGKYADANATLQKFIDKHPKHELLSTARMAIAALPRPTSARSVRHPERDRRTCWRACFRATCVDCA